MKYDIDLDSPIYPPMAPVIGGNSKHNKYMNMLSKIAIAVEPVAQARIAACLVYKNEVVSFGINQRKSHPFQAKFGKNRDSIFLHAETDCIKNALKIISVKELNKCSLYVCRVKYHDSSKNNFVFGLAKPCPGCTRAILNFDITKVIYSNDEKGFSVM